MSEKGKLRRARRQAKQERQAKNVIKWIAISLLVLGILFMIYTMTLP